MYVHHCLYFRAATLILEKRPKKASKLSEAEILGLQTRNAWRQKTGSVFPVCNIINQKIGDGDTFWSVALIWKIDAKSHGCQTFFGSANWVLEIKNCLSLVNCYMLWFTRDTLPSNSNFVVCTQMVTESSGWRNCKYGIIVCSGPATWFM